MTLVEAKTSAEAGDKTSAVDYLFPRKARRTNGVAGVELPDLLRRPFHRARETCELAGFGNRAHVESDLMEWNYGEYEGLTPRQIHAKRPEWMIFRDGCPGGESPEQIGARVDRVIAQARAAEGNVALFAHGYIFRVFAARWIGLSSHAGQHFLLNTATLNVLGYYRDTPALKIWNAPLHR